MARKRYTRRMKSRLTNLETGYKPPERSAYGFEAFEKGSSLHIARMKQMLRIRNAAYAWARRRNIANLDNPAYVPVAFSCAREEDGPGWRLFRVS